MNIDLLLPQNAHFRGLTTEHYIIIACAAAVIYAIIYIIRFATGTRSLHAAKNRLDMPFVRSPKPERFAMLTQFALFSHGTDKRFSNLFTGKMPDGGELLVFNFSYRQEGIQPVATEADIRRRDIKPAAQIVKREQTVVAVHTPELAGRFKMDSRAVFSFFAESLKHPDAHPPFTEEDRLRIENLHFRMAETGGGWMLVYAAGETADYDSLEEFLRVSLDVVSMVRANPSAAERATVPSKPAPPPPPPLKK